MRKYLLLIVVLTWITVTATPALASSPSIAGEIAGIEICPQFVREAAVFNGTCDCEIDKWQTIGFFWVSIQHDPLPPAFHSSAILGGKWNLTTLRGKFSGRVVEGSITNNGNSTFNVDCDASSTQRWKWVMWWYLECSIIRSSTKLCRRTFQSD